MTHSGASMPATNEDYQELWQIFCHPASLEETLAAYDRIIELQQKEKLDQNEASELKVRAFKLMQDAASDNAEISSTLIMHRLMPEVLHRAPDETSEVKFSRSRYRERLRDWLDALAEPTRSSVRANVLTRLREQLRTPEPDLASYAIGVIGFRDDIIVEALWEVADRFDPKHGDVAIAMLSALGLPRAQRDRIVSTVCERASARCNLDLIGSMRRLADPLFVGTITEHWLRPDAPDSWTDDAYLILRVLADIAEVGSECPELQREIWDLIMNYYRADPVRIGGQLYVSGDLAPRINDARVIPDLLTNLVTPRDDTHGAKVRRMQLHGRLAGCVRPIQLEGWRSPLAESTLKVLRDDARRDTGVVGPYKTLEMNLKEMGWDALLSHGDEAMVLDSNVFAETVGIETSPFIRGQITELLACFRLSPLPELAKEWVRDRVNIERADAGNQLVYRTAATKLISSVSTHEAFEILLDVGFTIDGSALRDAVDSLIDAAVSLARQGDLTISSALAEVSLRGRNRNNRVAATEALTRLAVLDLLPTSTCDELRTAILEESRDRFEQSRIVELLGFLPGGFGEARLERHVAEWAQGKDALALRSLEALARQDRLLSYPELLMSRLGLRAIGVRWELDDASEHAGGTGSVLGLLYSSHPDRFIDPVCSFLRDRDWMYAAELFYVIDHLWRTGTSVPSKIRNALMDRIRSRQTSSTVDLELFEFLARWAPESLAKYTWRGHWGEWLPGARVALADALGEFHDSGRETRAQAVEQLLALTQDGLYAVRRSAFRSLSRISPDTLDGLCELSQYSDQHTNSEQAAADLRRRGAEACEWATEPEFRKSFDAFSTDPEYSVRETAFRALKDRRKGAAAKVCLSEVLQVSEGKAAEILSAWKFGLALGNVGDDSSIRAIRERATAVHLPRNVRNWLERIVEGIEEGWRKTTQKWPEPWLSWNGSVEEGQGQLIVQSDDPIAIDYTLCIQPAIAPSRVGRWRGVSRCRDQSNSLLWTHSDGLIVFSDGRKGEIVITNSSSQQILFVGNGPILSAAE
jgi:hypothetical protein